MKLSIHESYIKVIKIYKTQANMLLMQIQILINKNNNNNNCFKFHL